MKMTRETNGRGSKNTVRSRSSIVSGFAFTCSNGTSLAAVQKRWPLSVTMSRARRPPWL
jgi:hypothetical protein